MLYHFLKLIIGTGVRLFYKEINVNNLANLNTKGPKIIIANHPQTLMDGWILAQISNDRVYAVVKGTFFDNKLKNWFLRSLGLIPINRATESKTEGVNNLSSFEACYRVLEEGKTLVIFPEGNSFAERVLRELKTGTARIALEVEKRNDAKLDLSIIPVGLIYLQAEKFRSSIQINVGERIDILPYLDEYKSGSGSAHKKLTEVFTVSLENLLIGSHATEYEETVDGIAKLLESKYIESEDDGVQKDVNLVKDTYARINDIIVSEPIKLDEIFSMYERIKLQLHQLEIKAEFLDRNYRPLMFVRQIALSAIFIALSLPFYIIGLICNLIPFKLVDWLALKVTQSIEYYAPVAILMSLTLYPLYYWGIVSIIDYSLSITFWPKFILFFSFPVFGLMAYYTHYYIKHVSLKAHFMYMMSNEKDKMRTIRRERKELRAMIFGND